jgi:hypothetical protein
MTHLVLSYDVLFYKIQQQLSLLIVKLLLANKRKA